MAKPKSPETLKKGAAQRREFGIKEALKQHVPYPPASRLFKVGERVNFGAHPNADIIEVFDSGRAYEVRAWGEYQEYGRPVQRETTYILPWTHLLPYRETDEMRAMSSLKQNQDIRLNYSNMCIDSCLSTYYGFGINMEPDYQRDYVWGDQDKVNLIDSVFCNRNIGSYILVHLGYSGEFGYEVLDGKQRIRALLDFYEDKFRYQGKLFSELHPYDQNYFEDFPFPRAEISGSRSEGEVSRDQKIKIFLHVNTCGRVMDEEHLEKVRQMLK